MDIKTLARQLRQLQLDIFSLAQLHGMIPKSEWAMLPVQLHDWNQKGWVRRLKRGLYELTYLESGAIPDFYIANRLYEPSYVSLDAALSHYQIIPETAAQVTSITTKPTRRFENHYGLFTYFTVQKKTFKGYAVLQVRNYPVLMAEPEKAVVDRLYQALRRGEKLTGFDRWDRTVLKKLNQRKLVEYARYFGGYQHRVQELLNAFLR